MHLSPADLAELESQLREAKDARLKMIVTDGVFSMDGDFAPLKLDRTHRTILQGILAIEAKLSYLC